jgi:outer membrane protein assembly factor BamE (lipoprotein component of BamABCDE complex)
MRSAVVLAVLLLLFAGCLLIPIPEHAREHSQREPIEEDSLQFMKVGSTTREEVLLNLGDPDLFSRDSEFKYRWETESAFMGVDIAGGSGRYDFYHVYELVVEFDDNGLVKGFEIKEEKTAIGLRPLF